MPENPTPAPPAQPEGAPNTTPQGDPADKPLGPNGERALTAEREARKALEQTVSQMQQAQKEQMAAIASALGVKDGGKGTDGAELLATLQKQVADMQHEALVYRVAASHGLTESEDVNFLKASRDEATMTALAKRLAAKAAAETPGTPKPDLTQGGKGGDAKPEAKPGMDRLRAAYANSQTK